MKCNLWCYLVLKALYLLTSLLSVIDLDNDIPASWSVLVLAECSDKGFLFNARDTGIVQTTSHCYLLCKYRPFDVAELTAINQASDVVSANIPPTLLCKGHEP